MRIISTTPKPPVEKRITCMNCGTKIAYVPNDVILLWRVKDYSGGDGGAKGFRCPQCQQQVVTERW